MFLLTVLKRAPCYIIPPASSDTYVKFKYNKVLLHKSRTVHKTAHPRWVESFKALNLDRSGEIQVKWMSYKRGRKHPTIGQARIQLADLELDV